MIKHKQILHKQQNNLLPLKMMFLSYLKQNQNMTTISDCHNAINSQIKRLAILIEQNYQQISQIVEQQDITSKKKRCAKMMDIIVQEDYGTTERQNQGQQYCNNDKRSTITSKFNQSIRILEVTSSKFQDIMFMYKSQIKQIAKQLTKQKQLTMKLNQGLKQSHNLNTQHKQNKQSRSNSFSKSSGNRGTLNSCLVAKEPTNLSTLKRNLTMKPSAKQLQSEDEQVRLPPKPFCQQCNKRHKQQQQKERVLRQQKNRWKQLSTKISNLKNQLSGYQQQLVKKQTQINRLQEQLKSSKQDQNRTQSQQKRKLRSMNTTLRGQKIVLQNQVKALKRKHGQNQQFMTTLQSQNKRMKIQKENLQSTIQWHINTINDLRANFSSEFRFRQDVELARKLTQSQQTNKIIYEQIEEQQTYLREFVQKLKHVEQRNQEDMGKLNERVKDLQAIIGQKNQTIVKLKMMGKDQNCSLSANVDMNRIKQNPYDRRQEACFGTILNKTLKRDSLNTTAQSESHGHQGFQQGMVKVLNKKLTDRDFLIQRLKRQNQHLKQQISSLKDEENKYKVRIDRVNDSCYFS